MKFVFIAAFAALLMFMGNAKASAQESRSIEFSVELYPAINDVNSSSIVIDTGPTYDAHLNKNISIPVFVYRGSTLKRTVYVWVEDREGKRVSSKSKLSLPKRFTSYNLTANISFSRCQPDGGYNIIAQGLGMNKTASISIKLTGCAGEVFKTDGKIVFRVMDASKTVESGLPFKTRLLMINPTDDYLEVDAWSYVYRSSKSYSGEREQNRKTLNLPEHSNVTFDLENTVTAPPGDYTLKIKFLRSDRKTAKEINLLITITGNHSLTQSSASAASNKLSIIKASDDSVFKDQNKSGTSGKRTLFSSNSSGNNRSSEPVYQSSSVKARGIAVYFLIAVLTLVLIGLILKKL